MINRDNFFIGMQCVAAGWAAAMAYFLITNSFANRLDPLASTAWLLGLISSTYVAGGLTGVIYGAIEGFGQKEGKNAEAGGR
ncbi:hypothetical protein [Halolamina salina]|uniref:Uncharacterized protein n=1 Tax=Halolamina salina TaxID=1220023 RepID=A0ABD6B5S3_9EURY